MLHEKLQQEACPTALADTEVANQGEARVQGSHVQGSVHQAATQETEQQNGDRASAGTQEAYSDAKRRRQEEENDEDAEENASKKLKAYTDEEDGEQPSVEEISPAQVGKVCLRKRS